MSFLPASRSACVGQNREMEVTTLEFIRVTSTRRQFLIFLYDGSRKRAARPAERYGGQVSERNEKGRY